LNQLKESQLKEPGSFQCTETIPSLLTQQQQQHDKNSWGSIE